MEKLKNNHFITKKGIPLQNNDLVQLLIQQIETHTLEFIKVKAHQHSTTGDLNTQVNYNSEVDKLARQMVREAVKLAHQGS